MPHEPGRDGPRAGTARVTLRKQALLHVGKMAHLSRGVVGDKARFGQLLQDCSARVLRQIEAIEVRHAELLEPARRIGPPKAAFSCGKLRNVGTERLPAPVADRRVAAMPSVIDQDIRHICKSVALR